MFDIGMTELLLIGIVALIVVGPKDLPGLFRTLGRFTAKARALGKEFTRAMNDAADQSGMKDAADGLKAASNPKKFGLDKLNDAATSFEKWDPNKPSGKADVKEPKSVDPEREEDARKIREAAKKTGAAKIEKERAEAEAAAAAKDDKPAAKKPAAKKAPAKKATAKSSTTSKSTATKPTSKSSGSKATTTKPKTTAKKTTTKASGSTSETKTTAKKPAAKKPAAKKPAAKKAPAKKAASE